MVPYGVEVFLPPSFPALVPARAALAGCPPLMALGRSSQSESLLPLAREMPRLAGSATFPFFVVKESFELVKSAVSALPAVAFGGCR